MLKGENPVRGGEMEVDGENQNGRSPDSHVTV
jgi:hypothetical protein